MAHDLEPYENITRVFWIKIELKEGQPKGRQVIGEIKDVMSGARQAICELSDIIHFIIPYLEAMGMRVHWYWRFRAWSIRKRRKNSLGPSKSTLEEGERRADL